MVDKYGPDGAGVKPQQQKHKLHTLKFSLNIGESDKRRHLEKAREFLVKRDQVRIVVQLKGREKSRPSTALEFLYDLTAELADVGSVSSPVKPGTFQVTLNPVKKQSAPNR